LALSLIWYYRLPWLHPRRWFRQFLTKDCAVILVIMGHLKATKEHLAPAQAALLKRNISMAISKILCGPSKNIA